MDNESKGLVLELREYAKNRLSGLESAHSKLQKRIDDIYNNNYVNYYMNIYNNNKNRKN